jgi:hypothetical protein
MVVSGNQVAHCWQALQPLCNDLLPRARCDWCRLGDSCRADGTEHAPLSGRSHIAGSHAVSRTTRLPAMGVHPHHPALQSKARADSPSRAAPTLPQAAAPQLCNAFGWWAPRSQAPPPGRTGCQVLPMIRCRGYRLEHLERASRAQLHTVRAQHHVTSVQPTCSRPSCPERSQLTNILMRASGLVTPAYFLERPLG